MPTPVSADPISNLVLKILVLFRAHPPMAMATKRIEAVGFGMEVFGQVGDMRHQPLNLQQHPVVLSSMLRLLDLCQ